MARQRGRHAGPEHRDAPSARKAGPVRGRDLVPATGQKQVWLSVRSEAIIERLESCPDPVRQGLGVTLPVSLGAGAD